MIGVLKRFDRHGDPDVVTLGITIEDPECARGERVVFEMSIDTARWPNGWSLVVTLRKALVFLSRRRIQTIVFGETLVPVEPERRGSHIDRYAKAVVEYLDQVVGPGEAIDIPASEIASDLRIAVTHAGQAMRRADHELRRRGITVRGYVTGRKQLTRYAIEREAAADEAAA